MAVASAETDVLAAELNRATAALRRALRRRTRAAVGEPSLSPADAELLRLVSAQPGLRVGDAAAVLRLAPNTVSTLVRRLVALGLLRADRDDVDRRAVYLRTSRAGERRLRRWRDERANLLAAALEQLSGTQRSRLARSLPVLAALVEALDEAEPE